MGNTIVMYIYIATINWNLTGISLDDGCKFYMVQ